MAMLFNGIATQQSEMNRKHEFNKDEQQTKGNNTTEAKKK